MNGITSRLWWRWSLLWLSVLLLLSLLFSCLPRLASLGTDARTQPLQVKPTHWVGTWGTAPGMSLALADLQAITWRNRVHTSIAGTTLRVTFSNALGTRPLVITQATIALAAMPEGAEAVARTMRTLTFAEKHTTTIAPGAQRDTDPLALAVPAESDLLITVSTPSVAGLVTAHVSGRQTSWYTSSAGHAADLDATAFTQPINAWGYITRVDVESNQARGTLVALGDSITDGLGSTLNANRRWTDNLAHRLLRLPLTQQYGILNEGIASNCLLVDGVGASAIHRLNRDVFAPNAVQVVILLEGINDIQRGADSATVIAGLQEVAALVHAQNMRLLAGTLTPFAGSREYTRQKEQVRQQVNAFLRAQSQEAASSLFDGIIDFDAAVRDPRHPLQFLPAYDSGDHLHPSDQGYQAMSEAVLLTQL